MATPGAGIRLSFLAPVDQSKYESLFNQTSVDKKYISASSAKDVLSRSGLDSNTLARIWDLSNVTQEPRLTFPEFATAMYLTSVRMTGKELPPALPDAIKNELQMAVATIASLESATSMGLPSTLAQQPTGIQSHLPQATAGGLQPPIGISPQRSLSTGMIPQRSPSTSMLSSLAGGQTIQSPPSISSQTQQPTSLQAQMTGVPSLQPQATGMTFSQTQQPTGMSSLQAQMTGLPSLQPQATGMPSSQTQQPTGMTSLQAQMTGVPSLQIQPTGATLSIAQQPTGYQVPMITGVTPIMAANPQITMPTGMNGNNLDFTNRMMPGASTTGQFQQFQAISGKVKIPWAVTVEEKQRYTKIFKAWDEENKGQLSGEKAKEIFSQSGLPQNVLMQIWNLADPNNQGKLNLDEFAVAMHLIYRKLNGYDVPTTLPPELVPPSTRELKETVSELKNSILQGIAKKKNIDNFSSSPSSSSLSPKQIRPSKSQTFSSTRKNTREKYVDNDDDIGYVSSARRMGPDRTRQGQGTPSPTASRSSTTSSYTYRGKTTRISELRKQIKETKEQIKKLEEEATAKIATPYSELSHTEKKDIDEIKEKIRELENEIVKSGASHSNNLWDVYSTKTTELTDLSDQVKSLESETLFLMDNTMQSLIRQLKETEDDLAEKKKKHVKEKAAKSNGAPPLEIVGSGPNGEITESDRIRAKAKALVAARMGKVTGKSNTIDVTAELRAIEDERTDFIGHADLVAESLRELGESVNAIHLEMSLIGLDIGKHVKDQKELQERRRFEQGENVALDLKTFIQELAFESATARAPEVDPTFETRFPSFE